MKKIVNLNLIGIEKRGINLFFENIDELIKHNKEINNLTDSEKIPYTISFCSNTDKPLGYIFAHSLENCNYYAAIYQNEINEKRAYFIDDSIIETIKQMMLSIEEQKTLSDKNRLMDIIINLILKKMC